MTELHESGVADRGSRTNTTGRASRVGDRGDSRRSAVGDRVSVLASAGIATVLFLLAFSSAFAQSLDRRVASAAAGNVTFHFAARPGVCGDGRAYLRGDGDMWHGSFYDGARAMPCESGPVRVVLYRDGADLLRIETYAGPLAAEPNATDLGAVGAKEAAAYLLDVARKSEGRPGRDALLPALLADSTAVSRDLLAIAREGTRPRDLRRSALGWLVRRRGEPGGLSADEIGRTVGEMARDENEARAVREAAVHALARLESRDALDALVRLSEQPSDAWLARQAVEALARSGDPRARPFLRSAAERADLSEEARLAAIGGIAGEYSTSSDGAYLRQLYRKVTGDRVRDAVMGGVASIGGKENREWLTGIARDPNENVRQRRRAVELADRVGLTASDLAALYDQANDPEVRSMIISELAQNGTKAASEKLLGIARNDESMQLRKKAVSALGRFDDPKIRDALKEIVER